MIVTRSRNGSNETVFVVFIVYPWHGARGANDIEVALGAQIAEGRCPVSGRLPTRAIQKERGQARLPDPELIKVEF